MSHGASIWLREEDRQCLPPYRLIKGDDGRYIMLFCMLCNVVVSGVDAGSVTRAQINHWEKQGRRL